MGVLLSQAPPAKRYRSSCGRTLRSKPVRSRPDFSSGAGGGTATAGVGAGLGCEVAQAPNAKESAAARATTAKRCIFYPGILVLGRSIKKAPSFGGSGLEKADFR